MSSPRDDDHLGAGSVISHLAVMIAVSAVLGLLVAGLAIPFAGALGVASRSATKGLQNLPQELRAAPLAQRSRLLSSGGKVIATFYDSENRTTVKLSDISMDMRRSIVAIEDYRFYHHGALDLKGTLRAFVTNQTSSGSVQGGSSITQQMAKLTRLAQAKTRAERKAATEDTYQRKIAELRNAIGFEQHYSKNWILQRYLNLAYFGDGAYGIQAASRHYFSKDAKNLNLRESAMLAGLVKNPVGFDPTTDPAAAKARRDVVLDRMAELKIITVQRAKGIKARGLGLRITQTRNGCVSSVAPFFCDYALRYLLADPSLGKTRDDRRQLINTGGLTIKSTIDLRFQSAARDAVTAHVRPTDQAIGALAMVQPGTGDVRGIAQSRPMGRKKKLGQTFLNYVVPSDLGDTAGFQAGSTFKIFVLAAALEQGMSPRTRIRSPQTITVNQGSFPDCQGLYPSTQPYKLSNSTNASASPDMYEGAQLSVNSFFVQLEQRTGLCDPYNLAKKMGVQLTNPASERIPSFTLGVDLASPLEMAQAYATLAARGKHCAAKPVTEILNSAGKVFKTYGDTCKQVMSQNTADTINDILRGVMENPGGFGQALQIGKPSAGKTGTIEFNKAVWFDGYTPALATVAMVAGANSDGHPITLNGQVVGGSYITTAHGSTTAGPLWGDAMRRIAGLLPTQDFVRPSQSPAGGQSSTSVPIVTDLTTTQAESTLRSAGFTPVVGSAIDSRRAPGVIAGQSPGGGSVTTAGATVTIYPSNGAHFSRSSPNPRGNPSPGPGPQARKPRKHHGPNPR
ncbi:MAG: transglycosylase domain-containing protein [Marmoricola sp.]